MLFFRKASSDPSRFDGEWGDPRGIAFPTVIGYPRNNLMCVADGAPRVVIGTEALCCHDKLDLIYPLRHPGADRFLALSDFNQCLYHHMATRRSDRPWGVVAHPPGIDDDRKRELRGSVSKLFDRVLLVEEPLLMARAIFLINVKVVVQYWWIWEPPRPDSIWLLESHLLMKSELLFPEVEMVWTVVSKERFYKYIPISC